MISAPPFPQAFARLPLVGRFALLALAAAAAALCARLWPDWRHNPDLSHGFFMPIVFLLLLHEARQGTARFPPGNFLTRLVFGALLAGGLLALSAAGLYAAAVDWSHALVEFMLTLSLALFLGAALSAFSGDRVRFVGFNWNGVTACALWLLCAPIPPGTYTRLTLGLQFWVSEGVVCTLHALGIAAVRHGNIIELAQATVGVEEACSGVRSLISCVFAGVFFSATLVRRPWARALLIVLAAPLALVMNFLRSVTLTLLANSGVEIAGTWHDVTGFAVLGVTAALLGGGALLLERREKKSVAAPPPADPPPPPALERRLAALASGIALAAALVAVFVVNTRPSARHDIAVPNLPALLPASFDGWQVVTTDLYEFSSTLQTRHLAQRRYVKGPPNEPTEITIYVAYWPPGQVPVSLVASHTPDACWPGGGWSAVPTPPIRPHLAVGGRELVNAEYRLFKTGDYPQHVWFWHLYDGRPITYRDPYSAVELLHIALRYGFRHGGDQLFFRVSSNRPWSEIADEPLLADFFSRTKSLGL